MPVNLSGVPSDRWFGRLLRWPLRLIPGETVVPILQGPLRGKKWVVGSSTHGCWLGSYEQSKVRLFEKSVGRGDVVYDVGAHVGFYTLLASVLAGPAGRVVAFEPLPRNLGYLRRHLDLNRVRNALVVEGAVCDSDGEVRLVEEGSSSEVRVAAAGTLPVHALTLDGLVFRDGFPVPAVMKIDVEGAETAVLRGAMRLLREKRPLLFLSTHGPELHAECCRMLAAIGYTLRPETGESLDACSELLGRG